MRGTLEDWQGLQINSEKTQTLNLKKGEQLDFLGFTLGAILSTGRFMQHLTNTDSNSHWL